MASSQIDQAIRQICDEKGLSYDSVIDAIEAALAAAYRKDFGEKNQNIETSFDPETGNVEVYDVKTVVEDMDLEEMERKRKERKERMEEFAKQMQEAREKGDELPAVSFEEDVSKRFNPKTDIMISDAKEIDEGAEVEDILRQELEKPGDFGRMAAMTAKQVVTQKLREAEREIIFNEFKQHEGELINGTVQRREGRIVLVDIGRAVGIMRSDDQIKSERYNPGDRIRVLVREVSLTPKGPDIVLSRAHKDVVKKLFEEEIPEVAEGEVEIKAVAREAGNRSKVAVWTDDEQIDPIGACIGQRGTRIQTIIAELSGEKIDIVEWSDDLEQFVVNALSPAEIDDVEINEEQEEITVHVDEDQLSLAIGRGGQNVRLAAQLAGYKINIAETDSDEDVEEADVQEEEEEVMSEEEMEDEAEMEEDAREAEELDEHDGIGEPDDDGEEEEDEGDDDTEDEVEGNGDDKDEEAGSEE